MNEYTYLGLLITAALTLVAWLRGWKGWACLPPFIALFIGFITGCIIGDMPLSDEAELLIFTAFAVCGGLCWLALIVMAICGRRRNEG